MGSAVLEARGITKSFAGNKVLEDVSIKAEAGQVLAVVGENGAGKSTLMKIIGGVHRPDAGELMLNGEVISFSDPLHAIKNGVSIVHQELSLVPNLSIAQNIFCHREPVNRLGLIKWPELYKKTRAIFEQMGLDMDPATQVEDLSVGMQQLVEIAKALSQNAKVLILDEPTSALSKNEVDLLYKVMSDLVAKGVAIIFISHKLFEVFRIADVITVLRDGRLVGSVRPARGRNHPAQNTQRIDEVIRMMVGRQLEDLYPPKSSGFGEAMLSVAGLTRKPFFEDISFGLRRGEILGFAGLVGAGRTEVARAIFGADKADGGRLVLEGRELRIKSPREAIENGICYLTEDRKSLGLFLKMPVRTNTVAASLRDFLTSLQLVKHKEIKAKSRHFVDYLKIRPFDDEINAMNLSGGNQQKVLLAKWLCSRPKVLIVDEPTRGVDVGAKAEIHNHLRKMAESGVGIIVVSSELPEILGLCDRVAVFNNGCIRIFLDGNTATEEEVMKHATAR